MQIHPGGPRRGGRGSSSGSILPLLMIDPQSFRGSTYILEEAWGGLEVHLGLLEALSVALRCSLDAPGSYTSG